MSDDIDITVSKTTPAYRQIERQLRDMITSGRLREGQKLPPSSTLAKQLGVHVVTLQKSMSVLKADGLLKRTPGLGTFVAKTTDSRTIALLIGTELSNEYAHFYRAIVRLFIQDGSKTGWHYSVYDGFSVAGKPERLKRLPVFQRLAADCMRGEIKGLIAVGFQESSMRVINSKLSLPYAQFAVTLTEKTAVDVTIDHRKMTADAVRYFAKLNKQRLIYLRNLRGSVDEEGFREAVRDAGKPDYRIQQIEFTSPDRTRYDEHVVIESCRRILHAWTRRRQWPEAVIMSDDIVMKGLAAAMIEERKSVPRNFSVMVFANDAFHLHYGMPVIRSEMSDMEIVTALQSVLRARMENRKPAGLPIRVCGYIHAPSTA
jgi:DNA-binding transcriptional regulator YhcF (GntR family)